jgi:hypothetical protein
MLMEALARFFNTGLEKTWGFLIQVGGSTTIISLSLIFRRMLQIKQISTAVPMQVYT